MRFPYFTPSTEDPQALKQQLLLFQRSLDTALGQLGFDKAAYLSITTTPEAFPTVIPTKLNMPVWGLKLVYLRNLTDDTAVPTNDVFVDWIPESGGVTIRNINGLTPSHQYELRFLAYA